MASDDPESDITNVSPEVARDLDSQIGEVVCPIHNMKLAFEVQEDGSVLERPCCPALAQIVAELRATS